MAYTDSLLGNGEEKLFEARQSWTILAKQIALRVLAIIALVVIGIVLRTKIGGKPAGNILMAIAFVAALCTFL